MQLPHGQIEGQQTVALERTDRWMTPPGLLRLGTTAKETAQQRKQRNCSGLTPLADCRAGSDVGVAIPDRHARQQ